MKLWLDDVRPPPSEEWTWSRNAIAALIFVLLQKVEEMSLDHDLGETYPTGSDFVVWLERKHAEGKLRRLPRWTVHSANPVGAERMRAGLRALEERINAQHRDR